MKRLINSYSFLSKKIVQHILFWTFVIIIEFYILSEELYAGFASSDAIWYYLLKIIFTLIATYINYLFLIPFFFKKKKFILFIIFNIINLAVFSFIVFTITIISFKNGSIYNGGAFEHHILFTLSIFYVVFFIATSTLLYFAQEWYKLKDVANKLILTKKEKLESEHNALKAQLNPHFLFNTLNNIYALSLVKSDDTPKVVLKLSSLMSYILYECKEDYVLLDKEIDFLNNYIELEKIRSEKSRVEFVTRLNCIDVKIAPLILIPFVENAFKHSKTESNDSTIEISLKVDGHANLHFYCENNVGDEKTTIENKYKGLGIENVNKRLSLLYPDKHQLKLSVDQNTFKVELNIKLNK